MHEIAELSPFKPIATDCRCCLSIRLAFWQSGNLARVQTQRNFITSYAEGGTHAGRQSGCLYVPCTQTSAFILFLASFNTKDATTRRWQSGWRRREEGRRTGMGAHVGVHVPGQVSAHRLMIMTTRRGGEWKEAERRGGRQVGYASDCNNYADGDTCSWVSNMYACTATTRGFRHTAPEPSRKRGVNLAIRPLQYTK
jgi:hypothetical protein